MACQRCGRCCSTRTIINDSKGKERKALEKLAKITGERQCKHLTFSTGVATCDIYENRPLFCREYLCDKAKRSNHGA